MPQYTGNHAYRLVIKQLQEKLPNLATVYPDYSWASTHGSDNFAVTFCQNGNLFNRQVVRVLVIVSRENPPRFFLEVMKGRQGEFDSLDSAIECLHEISRGFCAVKESPD